MTLRLPRSDAARALTLSMVVVGTFLAGALISRSLHSLRLVGYLKYAMFPMYLLFFLGVPSAALVGLVAKRTRPKMAAVVLWITLALMPSQAAISWLGFSQERALELLIERFEPVVAAIERFDRDHNRPPATLDELVPDYLDSIPTGELVDPVKPTYYCPAADRGDTMRTWRIAAGDYVFKIFDGPLGEIEYRADQQYEQPDFKTLSWGSYHRWQWVIWD